MNKKTSILMKNLRRALLLPFCLPFTCVATVRETTLFPLGEDGSFVGDLVQDTVGGKHFTLGNKLGIETTPASPVSSHFASFNGVNDYQFQSDLTAVPSDNFAAELWVRVPDVNQTVGLFATGKKDDGNLRFHLEGGYWAASYKGIGWIGADFGISPSQVARPDVWTHLAVIRKQGVSTFYINGVAQVPTQAGQPFHGSNAHLGIFSGSTACLLGDLDHIRIFTFDPQTDNPVASLTFPFAAGNETVLSIRIRQPGSRIILSWPKSVAPEVIPLHSDDLADPWTTVPGTPVVVGDQYELDAGEGAGKGFYRLPLP
ncbi:LamG domain-containing protein [Luteolibacter yonseiensis]|uniref:LamG domain-containing protein n=1 Tax=Luteolibacter yonseiensis TaxID=1144680 RepID=A0A934R0R4_9BACT|nr:LamG domain-containing protein [Luteolibacter yonseiensis]MBK1814216.1 LamG domain-containing protein [Luteolibacter yonseiensis]